MWSANPIVALGLMVAPRHAVLPIRGTVKNSSTVNSSVATPIAPSRRYSSRPGPPRAGLAEPENADGCAASGQRAPPAGCGSAGSGPGW